MHNLICPPIEWCQGYVTNQQLCLIIIFEFLPTDCIACCVAGIMSQEAAAGVLHSTSHDSCWPLENIAKPLHIQRVEEALKLDAVLAHVESLNKSSIHR